MQAQDSVTVSVVHPAPPEVISLLAAPGTGLDECVNLRMPVRRIQVSFSEALANPTDAGGYLLVGTKPDQDFSTLECSGVSGDDQQILISAIASAGDPVGTVALLDMATLSPGLYRLLVCDALHDSDGNPLDGDGDGNGGGELILSFRADPYNLFVNGNFDDCPVSLAPWDALWTATMP